MEKIIESAFLIDMYTKGIFPMSINKNDEIAWFSPDPRGIIPLDKFHLPHGFRKFLQKKADSFEVKINSAFNQVIRACAEREDTWISATIIASYQRLHDIGYGHSVEVWQNGELVGGLYGVGIGGAFFGESMFSRISEASKIALNALVIRLNAKKFSLLDIQWTTPHLKMFGAVDISHKKYMRKLESALKLDNVNFI